jgi:hypothetical protein
MFGTTFSTSISLTAGTLLACVMAACADNKSSEPDKPGSPGKADNPQCAGANIDDGGECRTQDGELVSIWCCDPAIPIPQCTGAWVDESGECRGPDDGALPETCCSQEQCWGAWLDENGLCRAPNDGVYPDECCGDNTTSGGDSATSGTGSTTGEASTSGGLDECWGAWVDEYGSCRAPNDGVYPEECCGGGGSSSGDPEACWGAWVDEYGTCRSPNDGVYPEECCPEQ